MYINMYISIYISINMDESCIYYKWQKSNMRCECDANGILRVTGFVREFASVAMSK